MDIDSQNDDTAEFIAFVLARESTRCANHCKVVAAILVADR